MDTTEPTERPNQLNDRCSTCNYQRFNHDFSELDKSAPGHLFTEAPQAAGDYEPHVTFDAKDASILVELRISPERRFFIKLDVDETYEWEYKDSAEEPVCVCSHNPHTETCKHPESRGAGWTCGCPIKFQPTTEAVSGSCLDNSCDCHQPPKDNGEGSGD